MSLSVNNSDTNMRGETDIDARFDPEHITDERRPERATDGSSGLDLRADIANPERLGPGQSKLFPSGLHLALPSQLEGQVRPRSGLAYNHGVTVLNSPGTIDSDYRGDIGVILINHGGGPYVVKPAERIAQLVITNISLRSLRYEGDLSDTERGEGGFGSTGSQ